MRWILALEVSPLLEITGGPETAEDGANSLTVVREQSSEQKPAESGPRPEAVSSDCCSFRIGARNTSDTSDSSVTVTAAGVAKRLLRRPLPAPSRRAPVGIATARLASGTESGWGNWESEQLSFGDNAENSSCSLLRFQSRAQTSK